MGATACHACGEPYPTPGEHDCVDSLKGRLAAETQRREQAERALVDAERVIANERADLATVPRGHCGRCSVCGWPLVPSIDQGCTASNCSMRPAPKQPRTTCAGCGAPFRDAARARREGLT